MAYDFKSLSESRAEIRIDGQIGGEWFEEDPVTAQKFAKDLKALGQPTALDIYINSPGGSVFDGSAIYSQLKRHAAKKTVYVEGLAASIASMIAMAGDEVVIPKNAFLMIHRASGAAMGTAADMKKMADVLEKIESGIASAYIAKTGRDAEEIQALMEAETWMNGEEAVALGFADRVTDPVTATACLTPDALRHFKTPPAALTALATPPVSVSVPQEEPMPDVPDLKNPPSAAEPDALPEPPAAPEPAADSASPAPEPAAPVAAEPESTGEPGAAAVAAAGAAIADACAKAGFPQLASGLIARQAKSEEVAARLAQAKDIQAACALARHPERVDGYLMAGLSVIEARADLFFALAQEDRAQPTDSALPVASDPLRDAVAAYQKEHPNASPEIAEAAVLRANPHLYEAYLARAKQER